MTWPRRAERRTRVGDLAAQGMSCRAIAERVGVSKDTVRRDLAALSRGGAPGGAGADAPPGAPDAPPAHGEAPAGTRPVLQVAVTADLMADLATLSRAGYTASGAVAAAVAVLASAHRGAWAAGLRDGSPVEVLAATVRPDPCAAARLALGGAA